jgi:hypothetical protein
MKPASTIRLIVKAIKPGRLYAVSGAINMTVIARHPCDAVMAAMQTLKGDRNGDNPSARAKGAGLLPSD